MKTFSFSFYLQKVLSRAVSCANQTYAYTHRLDGTPATDVHNPFSRPASYRIRLIAVCIVCGSQKYSIVLPIVFSMSGEALEGWGDGGMKG